MTVFDEEETAEISQALDMHVWMLVDQLETALKVLIKASPSFGRQAVDRACEMIAKTASEADDGD